jgi:hypothetical protein
MALSHRFHPIWLHLLAASWWRSGTFINNLESKVFSLLMLVAFPKLTEIYSLRYRLVLLDVWITIKSRILSLSFFACSRSWIFTVLGHWRWSKIGLTSYYRVGRFKLYSFRLFLSVEMLYVNGFYIKILLEILMVLCEIELLSVKSMYVFYFLLFIFLALFLLNGF